jgi:lipoate synthase
MRQKIISLSLDTYELASKKANFSAWVRKKLMDEARSHQMKHQSRRQMYEAVCEPCDLWYDSSIEEKMLMFMCHECGKTCKYMGPSQ